MIVFKILPWGHREKVILIHIRNSKLSDTKTLLYFCLRTALRLLASEREGEGGREGYFSKKQCYPCTFHRMEQGVLNAGSYVSQFF
jgi:hypothetical protein